jgi:transposase-like protein
MTKPLTTIGDALMAKGGDWRADLRANDVPRRPPPSRPDRGYVEQPEERMDAPSKPPSSPPRRRTETPILSAPVALIRFEREAPYEPLPAPAPASVAPPPPPEAAPPPSEPAAIAEEHVAKVAKDGRKLYTPQFRAKVIADFRAAQKKDPGVSQKSIAQKHGLHQTVLSNWLRNDDQELKALETSEKRKATYAAKRAAKEATSSKTLASTPSDPLRSAISAAMRARDASRTLETVSREYAAAVERVKELKAEMRALLDD